MIHNLDLNSFYEQISHMLENEELLLFKKTIINVDGVMYEVYAEGWGAECFDDLDDFDEDEVIDIIQEKADEIKEREHWDGYLIFDSYPGYYAVTVFYRRLSA